MINAFIGALSIGILFIGSFFIAHPPATQSPDPVVGAFTPAGGLTYTLQSSVGLNNTSITLSSFKNRSGIALTMTLLNTDIGYGTLDPQSDRSEFVSFTGITQNANGSATLTGVTRGLADIYPFTASTTMTQSHSGQSKFILSDSPQLFNEYPTKRGTEFISGAWGYQGTAPTSTICGSGTELCNKNYVDNVIAGGAPTSTEANGGKVELGTLAEQATSFDGGATKPTVLQTKNSTSTCQVVGTYNIVASSTTGKLDKNCFDQTANYTLTGNTTLANATSTSLGVTGSALYVNGVNYRFPAANGASSTVLSETGTAGTLTWAYPQFRTILTDGSTYSTSNTGTTTLVTIPIAANTMGTTSQMRIYVCQDETNSNNEAEPDIQIGTGAASTTILAYGVANDYCLQVTIQNMGSQSLQISASQLMSGSQAIQSTETTLNTGAQWFIAMRGRVVNASDVFNYKGVVVQVINP